PGLRRLREALGARIPRLPRALEGALRQRSDAAGGRAARARQPPRRRGPAARHLLGRHAPEGGDRPGPPGRPAARDRRRADGRARSGGARPLPEPPRRGRARPGRAPLDPHRLGRRGRGLVDRGRPRRPADRPRDARRAPADGGGQGLPRRRAEREAGRGPGEGAGLEPRPPGGRRPRALRRAGRLGCGAFGRRAGRADARGRLPARPARGGCPGCSERSERLGTGRGMSASPGVIGGVRASEAITAQVAAEVRTRLRSPGTVVALAAILLGAYLWIPNPGGKATSVSWQLPDGRLQTSVHSAVYIGSAMAFLGGFFAVAVGFYLVAGSIRRDRERGIGAILAATPLPNVAYLLGKWLAHVAYLSILTLLIVPIGVYHWLRFGVGHFDLAGFLGPLLLLALPGIAFVAAMAVLWDVSPGLSGRMGLVIWFFVLSMVAAALPIAQASNPATGRVDRLPWFDPMGGTSVSVLIRRSLPQAKGEISTGLIFREQVVEQVAWSGLPIDAGFVARRLAGILWALPPLGLALLVFDRFDPARRRLRLRRAKPPTVIEEAPGTAPAPSVRFADLEPARARPSALRAVVADAALLWKTGSFLRWAVVLAALLAAVLPASAAPMVGAAFLLLLAPLISEAACREEIAGAAPLVFSQPGVPRSTVLWKLGSVALFTALLGAPFALRALAASPARGFAALSGLLFVAALAVSFGSLSRGGKLFL